MDISIIIPNFNGENLLKENLPKVFAAVKEYKSGKVEIIIGDDASTDNSISEIEIFFKKFKEKNIVGKLVRNSNEKERGFSKNINRCMRGSSGEIIILLNSDVAPYENFLEPLLKPFSNKMVFAVGCMDESIENGEKVLRGRGIAKWEKGFLSHGAGELNKKNTLWVSGGSGAFRKTIWDKIGGLNELYNPFYWEDVDLSYRAQKEDYIVLFEKESKVIHKHNMGVIKTQIKSNYIQKIAYRNQFFFVWLNITDTKLLLSHILWLPYHLLGAVKNRNKNFLKGFISALTNFPEILIYRQKLVSAFIRKDKEILSKLSS